MYISGITSLQFLSPPPSTAGLFTRKTGVPVFRLKKEFKEKTEVHFPCLPSKDTSGGPKFEI